MSQSNKKSFVRMERRPVFLGSKTSYGAVKTDEEALDEDEGSNNNNNNRRPSSWTSVFASAASLFMIEVIRNSTVPAQHDLADAVHQPPDTINTLNIIQAGCLVVSAPVGGVLISHISVRAVSIIGTLLISAGLFLSSFASDYLILLLGLGLFSGVGQGLVIISSITAAVINNKSWIHQSVAVSLSGWMLGYLVPDNIFLIMMQSWGWRVGLRVISALALLCIVAASHLQDKEDDDEEEEEEHRSFLVGSLLYLIMLTADVVCYLGALILCHHTITPLSQLCYVVHASLSIIVSAIICDTINSRPLITIRNVVLVSSSLPWLLAYSSTLLLPMLLVTLLTVWMVATVPGLVSVLGWRYLPPGLGLLVSLRTCLTLLYHDIMSLILETPLSSGDDDHETPLFISGAMMIIAGVLYSCIVWIRSVRAENNVLRYQNI